MTITRFGTGSGKQSFVNQSSKTITYSFTAGKHAVVAGSIYGTTITVSDSSSTSWTVQKITDGGPNSAFVAYRENMPSGITSVTVTSDILAYGAVWVDEWDGVATSSSQDGSAVTAVNNTTPVNSLGTGNITPTDPNCLIYAAGSADDNSTTAWNTSLASPTWTEIGQEADTTASHATQVLFIVASGSTGPFSRTFSYPPGNAQMCTILVAFKPAAGASDTLMGQACL